MLYTSNDSNQTKQKDPFAIYSIVVFQIVSSFPREIKANAMSG
jgi:hypothetical protein